MITIKSITDKLAKKYNLSLSAAQVLGETEFAFTKQIMLKGLNETVNLKGFCKIGVKPARLAKLASLKEFYNSNEYRDKSTEIKQHLGRLAKFYVQIQKSRGDSEEQS